MKRYVIYDNDGNLTGCYLQEVVQDHIENHIEIEEQYVLQWNNYKANDSRNGIVLKSGD